MGCCHTVSLYLLVRQDQSTRSVPYESVWSDTEKDRQTDTEGESTTDTVGTVTNGFHYKGS